MNDLNNVWLNTLEALLAYGKVVSPRGMPTRELPQHTVVVDMRYPVLTVPERELGYKFMAAEAYWILTGDNQVATIAPYSKRISSFSDDGRIFFGAYGPKILGQLDYVVSKLVADPDTRQAGLTIWRENPPVSKDIPCTVAIWAQLREGYLNIHVFMRSSDVWLGLPYDVFNFSMLGHLICARLQAADCQVTPGQLYLTAASSHLYLSNLEKATACLELTDPALLSKRHTPPILFCQESELMERLRLLRAAEAGSPLRWWEADYAS